MYFIIKCNKCKSLGVLNIGNSNKSEVEKYLRKRDFGECPLNGYHVEFGKMIDYITVDYSKKFKTSDQAKNELRRLTDDSSIKESI